MYNMKSNIVIFDHIKKNHATAAITAPEIEISSDEALPAGASASGPSLAPASSDDVGDMSGVGAGGDEAEGESLVGPSELSPELESGLEAGVLADEDLGDFAGALPPEDGETLGVAVEFFLAVVGGEAVGGGVGAEADDFGDPDAAGEGVAELLGALAGVGGSAAKTTVTAKAATARDRSLKVIVIFE
ncbi:unnamed protein product [Microthlaspi erraticum]|uniref:Uncharacterized protein n=1 Tax=Microthlaspi erraticum TaxID=1685480 RepID=A0A6D2K3I8_9BRAS|nr:unnamed protein product [Microthlaspi erraticum]